MPTRYWHAGIVPNMKALQWNTIALIISIEFESPSRRADVSCDCPRKQINKNKNKNKNNNKNKNKNKNNKNNNNNNNNNKKNKNNAVYLPRISSSSIIMQNANRQDTKKLGHRSAITCKENVLQMFRTQTDPRTKGIVFFKSWDPPVAINNVQYMLQKYL